MRNTIKMYKKYKDEIEGITGYYSRNSLVDFIEEIFRAVKKDVGLNEVLKIIENPIKRIGK